ncbi:hypothetical protein SAMN05428971_0392 [Candidatus Pantoea varia]|uniref:RES domain-containing protein n=1 Tax=Candidatus Pantoea varia TaxID=1881036 RepID=A0A1I4WYE7_9GAMM|nr:hypothetical protein [Pantoea varia]SFN18140.1 hypothetical protein SAMN05428971_0392 [Pantoea varia]
MKKNQIQTLKDFTIYFEKKPIIELKKGTILYRLNWHEIDKKTIGNWYAYNSDAALEYKYFGAANRENKNILPHLIEGELKQNVILREISENHLEVFDRIYNAQFSHFQLARDLQSIHDSMSPHFEGFIRKKNNPATNEVFLSFPDEIIKTINITLLQNF